MSEATNETERPTKLMFSATKVMNPGPARIGRINEQITLPRTVAIANVVAACIGAVLFLIPGVIVFSSLQMFAASAGLGGTIGWLAMTYSPLEGESLLTWLGLKAAQATSNEVTISGINGQTKKAVAHIGIAKLGALAGGQTNILPGAIDVAEGSVDDRGRFLKASEQAPIAGSKWNPPAPIAVEEPPVSRWSEPGYVNSLNNKPSPAPASFAEVAARSQTPPSPTVDDLFTETPQNEASQAANPDSASLQNLFSQNSSNINVLDELFGTGTVSDNKPLDQRPES